MSRFTRKSSGLSLKGTSTDGDDWVEQFEAKRNQPKVSFASLGLNLDTASDKQCARVLWSYPVHTFWENPKEMIELQQKVMDSGIPEKEKFKLSDRMYNFRSKNIEKGKKVEKIKEKRVKLKQRLERALERIQYNIDHILHPRDDGKGGLVPKEEYQVYGVDPDDLVSLTINHGIKMPYASNEKGQTLERRIDVPFFIELHDTKASNKHKLGKAKRSSSGNKTTRKSLFSKLRKRFTKKGGKKRTQNRKRR